MLTAKTSSSGRPRRSTWSCTLAGSRFAPATVHRKTEKSSGKKAEKVGEKVGERVGEKLSQNQQSIIEKIIHNRTVSARELSEIIGISNRKIEENIGKLKAQGLLKRVGPEKGGHWEILCPTMKPKFDREMETLFAYCKSVIHECVTGQRGVTKADVERARKGKLKTKEMD